MTEDELRAWIPLLGTTVHAEEGAEWIHTNCPLAPFTHQSGTDGTPSMGFQVKPGESRIHCFSCMTSGTQMDLVLALQMYKVKLPWDKLIGGINSALEGVPFGWEPGNYEDVFKKTDSPFPESLVNDVTEPAYHMSLDPHELIVHPYLAARGVSFEVAYRWDLRFDPYRARIVAPVRDFAGTLMGLHGRSVHPLAKLRYLMYPHKNSTNPHIMLGEHLVTAEEPLVVAESMFDAFRIDEVYHNVLTPLKAGISVQTIKRLEGAPMVITLFDGDKAGDKAREKMTKHLKTCPVHHLIPEDGLDAGDMPAEELGEAIASVIQAQ